MNETDPDKIQMKMLMNASLYLRQQKISLKALATSGNAPGASTKAPTPGNAPEGTPSVSIL